MLFQAIAALYAKAVHLAECNAKYKEHASLGYTPKDSLDDESVECVHGCARSKLAQSSQAAADGQPEVTGCFIEDIAQQQRRGLSLHRVSENMIEVESGIYHRQHSCQAQDAGCIKRRSFP